MAGRTPQRRSLLALLGSAALAGCSALTPQLFSDRLIISDTAESRLTSSTTRGANPDRPSFRDQDIPLPVAIGEAEALQLKYIKAVKDMSEEGANSNAAMIGLAALGVFKGVTHPSGHDLIGLGVLGSANYAYASTMLSRPRQTLYLAGAQALACVINASRPYNLPQGWLRPPAGAGYTGPNLEGLLAKLEDSQQALAATAETLKDLNRTVRRDEWVGKAAAPHCGQVSAAACPSAGDSTSADSLRRKALCKSIEAAQQRDCAGPQRRTVTVLPHPDVEHLLRQVRALQRHVGGQISQARRQVALLDSAGNALWDRTVAIQLNLGLEVLKTEPSAANVLAAAQTLRPAAFSLGGAPGLQNPPKAPAPASTAASGAASAGAPNISTAQSNPADRRGLSTTPVKPAETTATRPEAELQAGEKIYLEAQAAANALRNHMAELDQRLRAASGRLDQCSSQIAPARGLVVLPADEALEVDADKSLTFIVSGGSGVARGSVSPVGTAAAGKVAAPTLDAHGQVQLVYTPDAKAKDGDHVVLLFTDGAGSLSHRVTVAIHKAAAADK